MGADNGSHEAAVLGQNVGMNVGSTMGILILPRDRDMDRPREGTKDKEKFNGGYNRNNILLTIPDMNLGTKLRTMALLGHLL